MAAVNRLYTGPTMESLLRPSSSSCCSGSSTDASPLPPCPPSRSIPVIAHRGCGQNIIIPSHFSPSPSPPPLHPTVMENTLLSFHLAAQFGAHFIEFDVQVTKDGHPVIFHDDDIVVEHEKSNSLVHRRIGELSLDEFLAIGYQKPSGKVNELLHRKTQNGAFSPWKVAVDDSLCTLRDALEQVASSVGFNIELKFHDHYPIPKQEIERSIDAILEVVEQSVNGRKIFFSSFHPDAALLLREKQSLYPVLFLTNGVAEAHADSRRNSLSAAINVCLTGNLQGIVSEASAILRQPDAVQQVKDAGLTLLTYGESNNVADNFHLQRRLGVDGMIVDHVEEMVLESISQTYPSIFTTNAVVN